MAKRALYSRRLAVILAPVLLAASCTLPGTNCGVQPQGGQTPTASQALTVLSCRAIAGDKGAQISLARAYETGVGMPRDMKLAVDWYKRAATPSTGEIPVYVAPVGNQRFGRTQNFQTGTETPGDAYAQFHLGEIYLAGDGVKQSDKRAIRWLRRAAHQGYAPADELLAKMGMGE